MLALRRHLLVDGLELFAQQGDTLTDDAFVRFYLRLTHTAVGATAASLSVEVTPHTRQARQHILQMRHLHLRLRITRLRALQEYLKDQYRAVYHAHVRRMFLAMVDGLLEVTYLPRTQLVVEDHHIHRFLRLLATDDVLAHFLQLPFAHIRRRIRLIQTLREALDGHNPVRVREERQLIQILFGAVFRLAGRDKSHQHRVLYIWFYLNQNATCGALFAPSSASKYGFFSNPQIPAMILFGKRRIFVLY